MKTIFKFLGVLLIVSGLVMVFVTSKGQENVKPNKMSVGVISGDGTFHQTDSGYIGGNREGYQTLGNLKNAGIMSCVAGGGLLLISFCYKRE